LILPILEENGKAPAGDHALDARPVNCSWLFVTADRRFSPKFLYWNTRRANLLNGRRSRLAGIDRDSSMCASPHGWQPLAPAHIAFVTLRGRRDFLDCGVHRSVVRSFSCWKP
jgi:hypothetical protein